MEVRCWNSSFPETLQLEQRLSVPGVGFGQFAPLCYKFFKPELLAGVHVVRYPHRKEKKCGRINAG